MPESQVIRVRWGILGTGWIADKFARDLLISPATRGATDVVHEIAAIGSQTSKEKAQKFAEERGVKGARYHGTYDDFFKDETIDVVYVTTPHSHHFRHVKLCLEAGKHVLCEKPFTMNAAQAQALADLARQQKRFLMEGAWTRFFPLVRKLEETIQSGTIGQVQRVFTDHGRELIDETTPSTSRFVDPYQGAGGFLDLGHYALTWSFLPGYHWKAAPDRVAPAVAGSMILDKRGFDVHSTAVLTWPDSVAVATTSLTATTDRLEDGAVGPATKIIGTTGTITLPAPSYRPTEFTVHHDDVKTTYRFPIEGYGLGWEVDSVARDIAAGRLESEVMPLGETAEIIKVMDQLREIAGLKYPDELEAVS